MSVKNVKKSNHMDQHQQNNSKMVEMPAGMYANNTPYKVKTDYYGTSLYFSTQIQLIAKK